MKTIFNFSKIPLLAACVTATMEYAIIVLSGDDQACYFHNSFVGGSILWITRIAFFIFLVALFTVMALPKYTSLKDRLLEKEELERQKVLEQERYWKKHGSKALKQFS